MKTSVRLRGIALLAATGLALTLPLATSASAALPQSATCAKLSSPPFKNGKSTGVLSKLYARCSRGRCNLGVHAPAGGIEERQPDWHVHLEERQG